MISYPFTFYLVEDFNYFYFLLYILIRPTSLLICLESAISLLNNDLLNKLLPNTKSISVIIIALSFKS
jgi:hypothetical protein